MAVDRAKAKELAVQIADLMKGRDITECMTAITLVSASLYVDRSEQKRGPNPSPEKFVEVFAETLELAITEILAHRARMGVAAGKAH